MKEINRDIMLFELEKILIAHEGLKLHPYHCSAGFLTIGVGHNLDRNALTVEQLQMIRLRDSNWKLGYSPITVDEALKILHYDISKLITEIHKSIPWDGKLDKARYFVLLDLGFNLGVHGLLKFHKMLDALQKGEWERTGRELVRSKWANQVQLDRVENNLYMILTGELPDSFQYRRALKND